MTILINARRSFGKGEVVSSILTGSTRKAHVSRAFRNAFCNNRAALRRTKREMRMSMRGKCVDFVPAMFRSLRDAKVNSARRICE